MAVIALGLAVSVGHALADGPSAGFSGAKVAQIKFLKLSALGLAGFLDYGGAWYAGTKRRTGWDFGAGLRFGPTRTTSVRNTRLDFAYRVKNDAQRGGWVLIFGSGFAFPASIDEFRSAGTQDERRADLPGGFHRG